MSDYLIDLDTGCWVWQRARTTAGYGTLTVDGKTRYAHRVPAQVIEVETLRDVGDIPLVEHQGRLQRAHRVFYELYVGPIPDGFQIDHICSNKLCVKPDHLHAVTALENVRRTGRKRYEN
ncbi:MAG TPA: HNH endonuclease signature motif containing protein [Actinomycetes bacterium]|nr:HNH endonuclease signature motif containing protein [Actinomycetes bacterium]